MALKVVALNSLWLLVGTVAGRVATLTANVLAARILGPEFFGQFMTVRATVAAVESIFTCSIGNVAVKHVSQGTVDGGAQLRPLVRRVMLLSATTGLVGTMVILGVAAYFRASGSAQYPYLETSLYLGCVLLVVTLLSSVTMRITIGLARFKAGAISSVTAAALSIPFIYHLTNNFGIYGALSALSLYFVLDASFKAVVIAIALRVRGQPQKVAGEETSVRSLVRASVPLAIATAISATTLWGIRVLAASRENGFVEIAYFDAAYQIFTVMMVLTGATTAVALQMFSRVGPHGEQDKGKVLTTHLAMNSLMLFGISAVAIAASQEVMMLFGADYATHHYLVPILCAVAFVATAASICEKLLISAASYAYVVAANGIGAFAAIVAAWVVGPGNQSMVLASAHLAYFLGAAIFYALVIASRRTALFGKSAKD